MKFLILLANISSQFRFIREEIQHYHTICMVIPTVSTNDYKKMVTYEPNTHELYQIHVYQQTLLQA